MEALQKREEQLVEIKKTRGEALRDLATKITSLWKQLYVPQDEQEKFLSQHEGYSLTTLSAVRSPGVCLQRLQLADSFAYTVQGRVCSSD